MMGYGGRYFGAYNCFDNGWMMIIMGMFFVIALVAFIYWLNRNKRALVNTDALEILKMKYINGEISDEEYIQKKNILNNTNSKHRI
ncbi:SHOCT domain-containing protein [Helicovermis profundi]|uniref:SHOCT domain-containing protein n=1 Tax=Helicovermis profundi TaxID=3065157 RepID=A0AAU9E6N6_9FIRM|nr:hypothetical protein HLPR_06430 [Clostridia bacterium S502]